MQNKMQIREKHRPLSLLLIVWTIIIGSYLFIRIFFIVFGFHVNAAILGGCLAVIPYLLAAVYLGKIKTVYSGRFYILGILLPCIVEKFVLYFMGALFYNIELFNVAMVMNAISTNEPYVNLLTQPSARYLFNLSFFGWLYILGSVLVSAIGVVLLIKIKTQNK